MSEKNVAYWLLHIYTYLNKFYYCILLSNALWTRRKYVYYEFFLQYLFWFWWQNDSKSETNKKWEKKQHKSSFYEFSVHNTDKFAKRDFTIQTFNCCIDLGTIFMHIYSFTYLLIPYQWCLWIMLAHELC